MTIWWPKTSFLRQKFLIWTMVCFDVLAECPEENPECKLLIIDTLQKIIGASGGTDYNYYRDSQVGGKLKNFADSHHICLLVIHHTPKRRDENDPFNNISGTNGFAGAADTNIVLLRNERMEVLTNMSISGRDVIETTYSIKLDGNSMWEFQGNAAESRINSAVTSMRQMM